MTLVYLAAAWVAGIVFARAVDPPWQLLPLLGFCSMLGLLLWWDERRVRLGALCLLLFALGAGRLLLAVPHVDARTLASYNGVGWVTVEGVVVGEPDERDRHTNLRVRAERLTLPDGTVCQVRGRVLVQAGRYPRRTYGDRLRISGLLRAPPVYEPFSYRDYLARQGVYSFIRRAQVEALENSRPRPLAYLLAFKRRAQAVIAEMLPEPEAGLLTGILLGVESGIPDELMEDFESTGTSHIIVISGFNITIVAGVFAGLAGRFLHRRRALLMAMAAVVVYTILVGASAAVVRAALMGVFYLFGCYVGRESYAPVSLAAAALAMTAWNPHTLWDKGFQLSFAATAGLLLYTRPLEQRLAAMLKRVTSAEQARQIVASVSDALLVTIAATATTTPILLGSLGQLSPVTLASNLLVLPAQSYAMLVGGLATIMGLLLSPLGRVIGWVAWLFLAYTNGVVRLTARLPVASLSVETEGWMVWGYYGVLGVATWWLAKPQEERRELWSRMRGWLSSRLEAKLLIGASGVLLALAVFAWRGVPDGRLHAHVLDVDQGDAIFIETPSGRQALIDGGPSPSVLLSRLGRRMPFWDRSLDLVVLTHPDDDHITGLVEVLERYRVDAVIFRDMGCEDAVCQRWEALLAGGETTVHRGEAGLEIALDRGVRMEVLHPGAELLGAQRFNDNSLVTRLSYGQVSLLLTGDIEATAEQALLADGVDLRSTVLKVAHHGACTSSTAAFLGAVDPEVAVISVGEGNDFGHPCDAVVERLEMALDEGGGAKRLFRTDWDGTVEVVSDGTRVWVETERGR
jgi:competence protein ComEC